MSFEKDCTKCLYDVACDLNRRMSGNNNPLMYDKECPIFKDKSLYIEFQEYTSSAKDVHKKKVEIWVGDMTNPAYTIKNPKRIDVSREGTIAKITDDKGWTFETSLHNIVIISNPQKDGG